MFPRPVCLCPSPLRNGRGLISDGAQEHVDFVNLMTYDLFGSWDADSNWIGPHVYGHTNLTVIKDALNLLWRNGVPANQVNLGLGFYGRYDSPGSAHQPLTRVPSPPHDR